MKTRVTAFPVTLLFTLMACGSISAPQVRAAQLDLEQPSIAVQGTAGGPTGTEFCADPLGASQSYLPQGSSSVGFSYAGNTPLIAQEVIEDCNVGGIPPVGTPLAAAAFPLAAVLGGIGGAGAITGAVIAATDGGGTPPAVPEPSDGAMAGLFAGLGITGIVLRRRMKSSS